MLHHLASSLPGAPSATAQILPTPQAGSPPAHSGHSHFWERALSRRRFVRTAAGATALVVGNGLWFPLVAGAAPEGDARPRPIPYLLDIPGLPLPPLHVDFPWYGFEVSTITDFNGAVASAQIRGAGTGTDTQTQAQTRYTFDADMRFMDGVYVGMDGHTRRGTFGFI